MIQVTQNSTSVSGFVPTEADDQLEGQSAEAAPAEPQDATGDPVAKFGATHGVHADVHQYAYGSGGGAGGSGGGTAQANAPANTTPVNSGEAAARKEAQALMDKGVKFLQQHRYTEALAAFEEGFRVFPDRAFLLNKASTLFDAGRYAESVMAFENYLSDPDAPRADEARATMERARAHLGGREPTMTGVVEAKKQFEAGTNAMKEGRFEDAASAFAESYENNPVPEAKLNQAKCLEKLNRPYATANAYETYLAAKPDAKDASQIGAKIEKLRKDAADKPITATGAAGGQEWMSRGNQHLFKHDYTKAIAAYEEGFRTYPDAKFMLNKAAALLDGGRYAEAVLAYESYLADPNAARADEARAAMERARSHLGGREPTHTGIVQAQKLFENGARAFEAGRYQEALDAFEQAYELNPLADFKFNMASCLEKLGRPYATASHLQQYLAEKPDAKDAAQVTGRINKLLAEADKKPITLGGQAGGQEWMHRGNRLLFAHKYNEAVAAFQEGFRTYPDAKFILNEAAAFLDGGRYEEAYWAYDRYLSDPHAPRADEAREAQQRALDKLGGRIPMVTDLPEAQRWFDKADAAFKAGRFEEALEGYERAYEHKPFPEFKYNQAVCLEKLGRNYAALSRYSQYLAEKPGANDAGRVRAHLVTLREKADTSPITASGQAGGYEFMTRGLRMLDRQPQRPEEAVKAFREGFRTYPDRDFIRYEAKALLAAGRYAEADLKYQTYLADPKAPHADTVRAEQQEARSHMVGGKEATATGVAESERLLDAGTNLYKAGRYGDAFLAFERAYELNPRGLLRYNQAACLDKMGKRELAAQRYEAYLKEVPNASDAAQVRTHITKLHADSLKVAQNAFDRAQVAFNAGKYKEAAAGFSEAFEQRPYPQFLYNVAASYDKAGDRTRAIENYKLYLSFSTDAPDAEKVKKRIEQLEKMGGSQSAKP